MAVARCIAISSCLSDLTIPVSKAQSNSTSLISPYYLTIYYSMEVRYGEVYDCGIHGFVRDGRM